MISKNNSAFRNAVGVVAALHGSAMACDTWSKTKTDSLLVIPLVFLNKVSPVDININKTAAVMSYLIGQNAVQIADFFKSCWKSGLLNPMPYVRLFTKNRDRSELAAIAVRNLLPLALLTQSGKECYTFAKAAVVQPAASTESE